MENKRKQNEKQKEGTEEREKREREEREAYRHYCSLLMNIAQLPVAGREIIWADLSTSQLSRCLNQSGEGHN